MGAHEFLATVPGGRCVRIVGTDYGPCELPEANPIHFIPPPKTDAGRELLRSFPEIEGPFTRTVVALGISRIEAEAALLARPVTLAPQANDSETAPSVSLAGQANDSAEYAELERLARAATPGPWHPSNELEDQRGNWEMVRQTATGMMVAQVGPFANWEADAAFIAAANPATVLRLLARRAPGDRGLREALERLEKAGLAFVDFNPGQIARASFWDALELARRALAADSRPEQPREDRDWQDAWNEWRAQPGGHPAVSAFEAGWNAALAVRPEEPPE